MKKNVLVIMTDQQRKDSLGCYGNAYAQTPFLDSLAREAVRFNRAYVANPICMPNRHSLFSGRYPHNHGVYTNGLLLQDNGCNILHHLSNRGWQTANIGKIHFTPTDGGDGGESVDSWADERANYSWHGPYWGFEYVELTVGHSRQKGHYREWFLKNGGNDGMYADCSESGDAGCMTMSLPEELHSSSFVGDRTCEWLRRKRDPSRPFFLVASFPDPHFPFDPPAESVERFRKEEPPMPTGCGEDLETRPEHYRKHFRGEWHRSGETPANTTPDGVSRKHTLERIRNTHAMVSLIDQNIGKILNTLRKLELEKDTIVIFTSDHGELLGDHGLWYKGPFYYEGLVNVPLLMRVPGVGARVDEGLFSAVDLAPTLCELLGVEIPDYIDGVSQAPHLYDSRIKTRDWCIVEYRNGFGKMDRASRALITERYKYVRYQNGERELTDLTEDPAEKRNVAELAENASVCSRLDEKMLEAMLNTENQYPQQISFA